MDANCATMLNGSRACAPTQIVLTGICARPRADAAARKTLRLKVMCNVTRQWLPWVSMHVDSVCMLLTSQGVPSHRQGSGLVPAPLGLSLDSASVLARQGSGLDPVPPGLGLSLDSASVLARLPHERLAPACPKHTKHPTRRTLSHGLDAASAQPGACKELSKQSRVATGPVLDTPSFCSSGQIHCP